jgi:selenocysteine lyase/cysteine desulfurase
MSPLLEVEDLHVEFRARGSAVKAVNGLSYSLEEGETLAILGESGSGKFGDQTYPMDDVRSRVHSGTLDMATFLTVPTALDCHQALGTPVMEARLRYLRDRWVHQVRDIDNIEILTPDDPSMHCGMTSFRISGRTSHADNDAIVSYLLKRHRIFTARRDGLANGDCIRVTAAQFTLSDQVDQLANAIRDAAQRFRA